MAANTQAQCNREEQQVIQDIHKRRLHRLWAAAVTQCGHMEAGVGTVCAHCREKEKVS